MKGEGEGGTFKSLSRRVLYETSLLYLSVMQL